MAALNENKRRTVKMFQQSIRYPYITEESEQQLFHDSSSHEENIEDDLRLDYHRIKEIKEREISSNQDWLSFHDIIIKQCNDDLCFISNQGVYYLMVFISLGALSNKYKEKIDFIGIELKYIFDHSLLDKLKHRINPQSYADMLDDILAVKLYYNL